MMIFKKAMARRTFLRGAGAAVALPLLDSMLPALAAERDAAGQRAPVRLNYIYVPNGRIMNQWTPRTTGAGFEMTPILEPLQPFRERITVVSHLSNMAAVVRPGEPMGNHGAASAAFLTGLRGNNGQLGISADQVAARELGSQTQLASLELTLDTVGLLGGGDTPVNDAYSNTISWRSATQPLPMESNPRAVFERLFGEGDSTDPAVRLARIRQNRSLLDFVASDVSRMMNRVPASDRVKLTEYLDGIRDVERRIQKAEEQATTKQMPVVARPTGVPATYDDHARLMFDLQVLAFQTDMTRVISFIMAHEKSERAYREIGIAEGHHALSHHQGDPKMIEKVAQIDVFQSQLFAYYLEKLRSTREGDGTLLDRVAILYGSGLSDGNLHKATDLPLLVAGAGGGRIPGGRHVAFRMDTPMTNLHLSLLDIAGVRTDKLGDSNGTLEGLTLA